MGPKWAWYKKGSTLLFDMDYVQKMSELKLWDFMKLNLTESQQFHVLAWRMPNLNAFSSKCHLNSLGVISWFILHNMFSYKNDNK